MVGQRICSKRRRLRAEDTSNLSLKELKTRLELVENNYYMKKLSHSLYEDWKYIEQTLEQRSLEEALKDHDFTLILERFRVMPNIGSKPD